VRDGVDEGVVLLVATDFAYEEGCVEDEPRDDQDEEDDAEDKQRHLAPVEQNPADVERQRERDQTDAEREEEDDRLATTTADAHTGIVGRRRAKVKRQKV
jgi:hypothetical protein